MEEKEWKYDSELAEPESRPHYWSPEASTVLPTRSN